ncbi:vinorine synthase-like [Salvia splendens]|uniref:vinorine synthase-like n=1 Tax=Salvia splendens TaxID=180675 RepID=UPI001C267475|nr:vinorine synthase-like [Salvia splendens]
MKLETKITSIATIKPSSPTPKSLQKHYLSFLDQIFAPVLMPIVYFYSSNPQISKSQFSNHLKQSLSKTLSIYYPLAGRLVGNLYVDCNDAGVPFAEAEANCSLSQAVTNPHPQNTYKFANPQKILGLCMAVQATYFRCGGVAVAISMSHKVGDALSAFMLAKAWSSPAATPIPRFEAATYFPPRDIPVDRAAATDLTKEEHVERIFTFPESEISALRERYSTGGGRRPSRSEALTAFIWTRFISATDVRFDPNKTYALLHLVNLRSRVDPAMSEYSFGNILGQARATPGAGDDGAEVVRKMREAVKAVDGVGRNFMEENADLIDNENVVCLGFSSLVGFPAHEVDFGLGKPVWIGLGWFPFMNTVYLSDAKCGGIEALIILSKSDMDKFQASFFMSNL